jgi:hypothetical protein
MLPKILALAAALAALGAAPQQTPKSLVTTYDSLADAILAIERAEDECVRSILAHHYEMAKHHLEGGDAEKAAAEVALFANEGDNAIGGVRKRLLDGGHFRNAGGHAEGFFDSGFVLVTRKVKEDSLAISAALRQSKSDGERKEAWQRFETLASPLLQAK